MITEYDDDVENAYLCIVNNPGSNSRAYDDIRDLKPGVLWDRRSSFVYDWMLLAETDYGPLSDSTAGDYLANERRKLVFLKVLDYFDEDKLDELFDNTPTALDTWRTYHENDPETLALTENELGCIEQADIDNPPGEKTMRNTVPFESKDYVFGQDVANMNANDLLAAMRRVEAEIAELKDVKTKSKYVEGKIKELEDGLARIVEKLDAHA